MQVQAMPTRPPTFSKDAVDALAASYPDQNILGQAMAYDPTDVRSTAAFSTNHMSAYMHHAYMWTRVTRRSRRQEGVSE